MSVPRTSAALEKERYVKETENCMLVAGLK